MVLEGLGSSLKNTLTKITNAIFVDEKLINELVKDIQKALLQADVNVRLVFDLTKRIKERALHEEAPGAMSKKEWLIKIVYDELVRFLGEEEGTIEVDIQKKKPFKIMLVGLFGSGKTTTAGKLGKYFQKRGFKVALVSTDTWRPAAYEQLRQLGEKIGAPVFGDPKGKDPVKVYKKFEPEFSKFDVVIIDTAGRDALNDELIQELNHINKNISSHETLLVLSADIGQAAEKQAQTFHDTCHVTGIIITKLDGTAKGGGSLAACSVTGAKVKFIGLGEKIDDFEKYRPKNFVGRMLGMGDLEALLEKAKEAMSDEQAQDLGKKFLKGEFTLIDLYDQMSALKKMGKLDKILEMIPGFGQLKLPKEMLESQEGKLDVWKYSMNSMTKQELENPEIIDASRINRIAKGAGRNPSEIRELLKQYKQGKKMMKMFKGAGAGSEKGMEKMMKRMGGMKGIAGMGKGFAGFKQK